MLNLSKPWRHKQEQNKETVSVTITSFLSEEDVSGRQT
jgi:hypothetical protein